MPQATPPEYESIDAAARRHDVHPDTIRRRITAGTLPAYRIGRNIVRLRVDEVDANLLAPVRTASSA